MNNQPTESLTTKSASTLLSYLEDHHLMDDTILTLTEGEMYEALCYLLCHWRVSLADTLAHCFPDVELQFDTIEHRLAGLMREA